MLDVLKKPQTPAFLENEFQSMKKAFEKPLDSNRKFVVRLDEKYVSFSRILLYRMRAISKNIWTNPETHKYIHESKLPNHCYCGNSMHFNSETVDLVKTKQKTLAFKNVARCGLVWRCPICSFKIVAERQSQLMDYVKAHYANDCKIGFVTLTIRHKLKDKLKDTLHKLNDNYRRIQQTRDFRKFKNHLIGQVKALELTYSNSNGWHPHLHILYFYKKETTNDIINRYQSRLINQWVKFRDNNSLKRSQDFKIAYDNDIVEYMSKWHVVKEVTAQNIKKSKGLTPFSMLRKLALDDYENLKQKRHLINLYRDYTEALKGKARLFISSSIKKQYQQVNDKTDEQIITDVDVDELLLKINFIIWHQITKKRLEPYLINAYKESGLKGFYSLLERCKIDFDIIETNDLTPQII